MNRRASPLFVLFALAVVRRAEALEPDASSGDGILALDRFELRPFGGWALAQDSVTGAFVGANVAYRFVPLVAVGADFAWYGSFNRSGGANPTHRLNGTDGSGDLDAYVIPWPVHGRSGSSAIGLFEPYLLAGVGAVRTHPIPVVDPTNRQFDRDNTLVDLCFGVGSRFFLEPRIALVLEARDVLYFEKLESSAISNHPQDPSTWYDPRTNLTNAIQLRLGVSFLVGGRPL